MQTKIKKSLWDNLCSGHQFSLYLSANKRRKLKLEGEILMENWFTIYDNKDSAEIITL